MSRREPRIVLTGTGPIYLLYPQVRDFAPLRDLQRAVDLPNDCESTIRAADFHAAHATALHARHDTVSTGKPSRRGDGDEARERVVESRLLGLEVRLDRREVLLEASNIVASVIKCRGEI